MNARRLGPTRSSRGSGKAEENEENKVPFLFFPSASAHPLFSRHATQMESELNRRKATNRRFQFDRKSLFQIPKISSGLWDSLARFFWLTASELKFFFPKLRKKRTTLRGFNFRNFLPIRFCSQKFRLNGLHFPKATTF